MMEKYLRLIKAAQGLDHLEDDPDAWGRYMKAYYEWLETL